MSTTSYFEKYVKPMIILSAKIGYGKGSREKRGFVPATANDGIDGVWAVVVLRGQVTRRFFPSPASQVILQHGRGRYDVIGRGSPARTSIIISKRTDCPFTATVPRAAPPPPASVSGELLGKAREAAEKIEIPPLDTLPLDRCVTLALEPRAGKTLGTAYALARGEYTPPVIYATTTRALAASFYMLLRELWEGPFEEETTLHLGRGVGRAVIDSVEVDLSTCHPDMFPLITATAEAGGNLEIICSSCAYRENCRYLRTRREAMSGRKVVVTTLATLEYLAIPASTIIVDEMSASPPITQLSRSAIQTAWQSLKDNPNFVGVSTLCEQMITGTGAKLPSLTALSKECQKLRVLESPVPRPIISAFGERSSRMSLGMLPYGDWLVARVPRLYIKPTTRILYLDATPTSLSALWLRRPLDIQGAMSGKWPISCTSIVVPLSRERTTRDFGDDPQTRFVLLSHYLQLPTKDFLASGFKECYLDTYLWGARGGRGAEGRAGVIFFSYYYQQPPAVAALVAHLLAGADSTAVADYVPLLYGYHHITREPVRYPYPAILYRDKFYTNEECIAAEALQVIGRVFPVKNGLLPVVIIGLLPLAQKAKVMNVVFRADEEWYRIAARQALLPWHERNDEWRTRSSAPVVRFMSII